jgi:hypothetical protein
MAGLLPAPLVGAMAEGLDAVEDEAQGKVYTALEAGVVAGVDVDAAVVAVVGIRLPLLRASPTSRTTSMPSRFSPLRHSTKTTWF